ncbi:MAG TPA: BatD family protein, partial [Xanthomonadales bacterium]|nr:BatD family protein [Xanthomonadales bacterium]
MVKQLNNLAACWIGFLLCLSVEAAEMRAQLDRDHVVEGETVTLTIETNNPQQRLDGDFGMLDGDFELLDQRSETQMSIVNGQQSAIVRLILTLEPRRSGEIIIPALHFGAGATAPLRLLVDAAPEPQPGEAPPVFIEVDVQPDSSPWYVHAQILLTVRVFYQLSLTEAAISQPEPASAAVRLLDEVPFQADRHGQRYKVLERHYAVFPERSGPLVIPPMQLSGRVVERRSDKLWQPAVRGRRIEVESEPRELLIQPKPASFSGKDWLP